MLDQQSNITPPPAQRTTANRSFAGRAKLRRRIALPDTLAKARCRPSRERTKTHGGFLAREGEVVCCVLAAGEVQLSNFTLPRAQRTSANRLFAGGSLVSLSEPAGRAKLRGRIALPDTLAKARCRPSRERTKTHGGFLTREGEVVCCVLAAGQVQLTNFTLPRAQRTTANRLFAGGSLVSLSEPAGRAKLRRGIALPVTLAKARCRPSRESTKTHCEFLAWEGEVSCGLLRVREVLR